jgi:segregation and condensation protein B
VTTPEQEPTAVETPDAEPLAAGQVLANGDGPSEAGAPAEPEPGAELAADVPADGDGEPGPTAEPAESEAADAATEPAEGDGVPVAADVDAAAGEPPTVPGEQATEYTDADGAPVPPPIEAAGAEGEESGEVVLTASDLPDLTEDDTFHAAIEALLLVVDAPAEDELLADTLDQPVKRVREALVTMSAQYHQQDRGIDLRNVGGGWRFYTRDRYAPFVEKLLLDGQRAKLTRAALESLAVIAYRQPVTRSRVAAVRGVNVDGVIRTLLARGLIEETGTDKDTGGILYRTTELFLERLGLSSLEDLPPIAPLLPEVDAIDDV